MIVRLDSLHKYAVFLAGATRYRIVDDGVPAGIYLCENLDTPKRKKYAMSGFRIVYPILRVVKN